MANVVPRLLLPAHYILLMCWIYDLEYKPSQV